MAQPVDGVPLITTAFCVGSPSHSESIIVMESHTPVRFATEMRTQFNRWLEFLRELNGGKTVVIRQMMFDCYAAYFTHFCETLNKMSTEEYLALFRKYLKLGQDELPNVNTLFSHCTKHVSGDWMIKVKSIERLNGLKNKPKRNLLCSLTHHSVHKLIDSETPMEAMHIMNAFLFLVGTASWMITPGIVNAITDQHIDFGDDGSILYWSAPQSPSVLYQFVHDVELNVYKSRVMLFGEEVIVTVHVEDNLEASGAIYFCGKVFSFHFDEPVQRSHHSSSYFVNSFIWCPELLEYAKKKQFPKAVLYMKQCKPPMETTANQMSEGTWRNERQQPLGCLTKRSRLDLRIFGRIEQMPGQIARFIEGNKLQYTREYNERAEWGPIDPTSQIFVDEDSKQISELFMEYWRLKGEPKYADCVSDYKELQKTDAFLRKGPSMNTGNISKMKRRRQLPSRGSWRGYVTHWLETRVNELKK